ncbi:ankyrin repeat domain-containing protein [Endozoicomonas sp. Mp262]|uniref:ankyrin repeat domain-containing protein n=1 Tax=Endozoicomonas sp. Mp262 TaxID=2919499 RepID=UPI0021D968BF
MFIKKNITLLILFSCFYISNSEAGRSLAVVDRWRQATQQNRLEKIQEMLNKENKKGMLLNVKVDGELPIIYALEKGFFDLAQTLISHGADINVYSSSKLSALSLSFIFKDKNIAKTILMKQPNKDSQIQAINQSLDKSESEMISDIHLLQEYGIDIDQQDNEGFPVLFRKAVNGDMPSVSKLLSVKVDVDASAHTGETPLLGCCWAGYKDIATALIEAGAQVNKPNHNGDTPLIAAASNGHRDIAVLLMDHGAELEAVGGYGFTPFIAACENGDNKVIQALIEKKANLEATDHRGLNGLMWAAIKGHLPVAKMLIKHGAKVNTVDPNGFTALLWASHNGHSEIVELLLQGQANISFVDEQGCTALIWAAINNYEKIMDILISHSSGLTDPLAFLNTTNLYGNTALMTAACNGMLQTVEKLITQGVNIEISNYIGSRALHLAVKEGRYETVKVLLENKANPNARDSMGATPLHYACSKKNNNKMITLLLDHQANASLTDKLGASPLLLAAMHDIGSLQITYDQCIRGKQVIFITRIAITKPLQHLNFLQSHMENKGSFCFELTRKANPLLNIATYYSIKNALKKVRFKDSADITIHRKGSGSKLAPIHCAVLGDNIEIFKTVLCNTRNIDVPGRVTRKFSSPLLLAVELNKKEHVTQLLSHTPKPNINIKAGNLKNTPLHIATEMNLIDMVELLVNHQADVNAKNRRKKTPLHIALERKSSPKIIKKLLDAGADITILKHAEGEYHPSVSAQDMLHTMDSDHYQQEIQSLFDQLSINE